MPNQDPTQNPQPISDPPVKEQIVPPSFSPQSDLPPMPPDFQNIPEEKSAPVVPAEPQVATEPSVVLPKVEEEGSAAPPDIDISSVIKSPKKKYGTGKIIATILGLFLLVGGVGAGIVLTQQKQLFQQKAATCGGICRTNCNEDEKGQGKSWCDTGQYLCIPNSCDSDVNAGTTCVANDNYCVNEGTCPAGKDREGSCNQGDCCDVNGGAGVTDAYWPKTDGTVSCKPPTSGTVHGCITIFCPSGCGTDGGCGETTPGAYWQNYTSCTDAQSALGSYCGQVDTINENNIYCEAETGHNSFKQCYPDCAPPPPKTPNPAPSCIAVKTYSSTWTFIDKPQLPSLKAGDVINFCVSGSAPSGTFDKAQFTINGAQLTETTTHRPSTTDFCQSYTILSTDTTVNVKAKIYHSSGIWVGEII